MLSHQKFRVNPKSLLTTKLTACAVERALASNVDSNLTSLFTGDTAKSKLFNLLGPHLENEGRELFLPLRIMWIK